MIQALLLMGKYQEAEETMERSLQLQQQEGSQFLHAKIKFEKGDLIGSKDLLKSLSKTQDVELGQAAILSMEGKYEEALEKYSNVFHIIGFRPDVAYSIAHCHYRLDQHHDALVILDEIILRGQQIQGSDEAVPTAISSHMAITIDKSALQNTFLIEALNLKIAVEYDCGKILQARQTWNTMPIGRDEDIDAVSLHNQAIIHIDDDTDHGLSKLIYLLNNPPLPSETFMNLIVLCCKYDLDNQAADLVIENRQLLQLSLPTALNEFLETYILVKTSTDEALKRLERLSVIVAQNIRKLKKKVQDIKKRGDDKALRRATKTLSESMQLFVPILMTQTKIYWDRFDYRSAEETLRIVEDICNESEAWQINMAHAIFMQQGDRYDDAIGYFAALIDRKKNQRLLEVSPIAIANLCVAYIMVKRNDEAETLLKLLEQQEEHSQYNNEHDLQSHHSCIVNLVIGTLYCERGNFDFGIDRICKSLQPYEEKLGADTWYYAKLCLLTLIDKTSKQMVEISDNLTQSIHSFLDDVYVHGVDISAALCPVGDGHTSSKNQTKCISDETRILKHIFLEWLVA